MHLGDICRVGFLGIIVTRELQQPFCNSEENKNTREFINKKGANQKKCKTKTMQT